MKRVLVWYSVGVKQPITPDEPLAKLPAIPRGSVVVITGRAPIWRYGMAFHQLHGSPAAAIAVFDPRLGAVIVASHTPGLQAGEILGVTGEFAQLAD